MARYQMPPVDPMVDQPDLQIDQSGGGILDTLAQAFAANPIKLPPPIPGRRTSDVSTFLAHLLAGGANALGSDYGRGPKSPATRIALAHANMERAKLDAARREADQKNVLELAKIRSKEPKPYDPNADESILREEEMRRRGLGKYGQKPDGGLNAGEMNDPALDMVARTYLRTGQLPPLGMGAAGLRTKILDRAAQLDPNADVAGSAASYQSDKASLSKIQQNIDAVEAFSRTALKNADLALQAIEKVPDTGSPIANQFARAVANKALGSTDVQNFETAMAVAQPEFARVLSSGNVGGQMLTDAARRDMQAVISGNFTRKQLRGAIDMLKRDTENRRSEYQAQADAIKGRISGGSSKAKSVGRYNPATGKVELY